MTSKQKAWEVMKIFASALLALIGMLIVAKTTFNVEGKNAIQRSLNDKPDREEVNFEFNKIRYDMEKADEEIKQASQIRWDDHNLRHDDLINDVRALKQGQQDIYELLIKMNE